MRRFRKFAAPANWPFLCLVMAWLGVNVPAEFTLEVFSWARGAQHFSHQQALRTSVLSLVHPGPKAIASTATVPYKALANAPSAPAKSEVKKVELAFHAVLDEFAFARMGQRFLAIGIDWDERGRTEPPLPPPRAAD